MKEPKIEVKHIQEEPSKDLLIRMAVKYIEFVDENYYDMGHSGDIYYNGFTYKAKEVVRGIKVAFNHINFDNE